MEGVGGVAWVVNEAVSSIVALREGYSQLGVNVLHELSSIVHRLDGLEEKHGNCELLWRRRLNPLIITENSIQTAAVINHTA